jgi:nucleotide-binding universal stress UspA family protein
MPDRLTRLGILAGVDGSACSRVALRWAADEAVMRNVPLTLVHVLNTPEGSWSSWGLSTSPLPADFNQKRKEQALQVMDDAVKAIKDGADRSGALTINTELLFSPVVPTLIDLADDAQMIVVGSHGRNAVQRGLLGSVSTGLIHHARCPVAVIHDTMPAQGPVVVGIDGSPASELATAIAFEEASWRGVYLVALHVWSDADGPEVPDRDWSDLQSAAMETLAERLAGWQERYPDVSVRPNIALSNPARRLINRAEGAQLVVVGSRGRGGFPAMLLGSVSSTVVHAVHAPVIVARPKPASPYSRDAEPTSNQSPRSLRDA